MKTFLKIVAITLFVVALVAAVGAGFAAAQSVNTPASPTTGMVPGQMNSPRGSMMGNGGQGMMANGGQGMMANGSPGFGRGMGLIDMKSIIAEALGITVEELDTAQAAGQRLPELVAELGLDMDTVQANIVAGLSEAINQAVTEGTITQEQADLMLARLEMRTLAHDLIDMQAIVADALGITVEDLLAAHADGQYLPELVDELGLDLATVQADIQAEREAAINQALADGLITQEQADWLLSHGGHAGMGYGGGQGHRGGGNGGNCPNMTPPTDNTVPTDEA
ncbi:MAG: hypothetical protein KA314_07270 [Chloroflexi bacterium]|nr:hypothetical protein [Chloroflexota bacterium]MBP8055626.1 hypothetical protein [Chloroflexota bacterium]